MNMLNDKRLILYLCLDCDLKSAYKNAEGLRCPKCKGRMMPLGDVTVEYCSDNEITYYHKPALSRMNYKAVLEGQICELEKLQQKNVEGKIMISPLERIEAAVKIAEEIRLLIDRAERII